MSLVIHKYMPEDMSEAELEGTFAAREHTLDYLVQALRDQIGSASPSSFLISGPRGAGKSTLLRMVRLRIRQDPELAAAWLPIPFPENQYHVASLRDLLAGALEILARQDTPDAQRWLQQVEEEAHDEQSQEIAISGLREIAKREGKRLVVFAENLDQLFERGFNDKMKRTLRRLLMTEPFMVLIGSAVRHTIEALRGYDEAFFNYFHPVPLDRLSEDQVVILLRKRAEFDGNAGFLQSLPRNQARIKAIAHLSGGNPRLILMLYELLSEQRVTSIVQQLRRLVDELTPVLQCEMDNLAPQQQKIIHALMERGGTASPKDLTGPTRLSLNSVTQQLRRLKDAQVLEVSGGGKGRPAFYTVPDKLFAIWYQMRCLRRQRRRIEMFVEVLQVWFEAEERFAVLRSLVANAEANGSGALKDAAPTVEYFAASLVKTPYEDKAREMMLRPWIKAGEIVEAARAHAAFCSIRAKDEKAYDVQALLSLGDWCREHDHPQAALEALQKAAGDSTDPAVRIKYARALRDVGRTPEAIQEFTRVLEDCPSDEGLLSQARVGRATARGEIGDYQAAIADWTVVIEAADAPRDLVAWALVGRGAAKRKLRDAHGEVADYTAVLDLGGVSKDVMVLALAGRGAAKVILGDGQGAIADYTAVIGMVDAPKDQVARALTSRGVIKGGLGDAQGMLADCAAVIEMTDAPKDEVALALFIHGMIKGRLGNAQGRLTDWKQVLELPGLPTWGRIEFAREMFAELWRVRQRTQAIEVLGRLYKWMATLETAQRVNAVLNLLTELAVPDMKEAWSVVWRTLVSGQPPEVLERLDAVRPVVEVLETSNPALLHSLPPEQREFAERILKGFEAPKT